jgi:hypothetical protein
MFKGINLFSINFTNNLVSSFFATPYNQHSDEFNHNGMSQELTLAIVKKFRQEKNRVKKLLIKLCNKSNNLKTCNAVDAFANLKCPFITR